MKYRYKQDNNLTKFARENRKKPTYGENKLWQLLRGRRLLGYKFRRQHPFKNYILDFYCNELALVIEIDGSSHDEDKYNYDRNRHQRLETYDLIVIRFTEADVMKNTDNVLQSIVNTIDEMTSP